MALDAFCIAFCGISAAKLAEFAPALKRAGKRMDDHRKRRIHSCLLTQYFAFKAFVAQDVFLGNTQSSRESQKIDRSLFV